MKHAETVLTGTNQEIVAIQTAWSRFVPILLAVVVHELPSVVRFVSGLLHPWGDPLII